MSLAVEEETVRFCLVISVFSKLFTPEFLTKKI